MSKHEGKKHKPLRIVLAVLGIVLGVLVVVSVAALAITEGERREGRDLPIAGVDFSSLPDGTHHGSYEGGRYGWRANEVDVTVSGGKVTQIEVVKSASAPVPNVTDPLFARVVAAQSLQVDTISGATITSKAFLKSVEDALTSGSGP
jgi:uncharacterized protein with FMN-binding domain